MGSHTVVLGSHCNLEGNVHHVQSPWCPASGRGCPQTPCSKHPHMWHQPWLPMEQDIYKRKSGGTDIINPKRAWEKLLLAARAIVTTQTTADDSVVTSRNTGQGSVLWFAAAATGAMPIVGHVTPGIFTKQIQGACQECCLLLVIDPKADNQPPSVTSYANLPPMSLWVTQTLLCTVWTLPPRATTRELTEWASVMWWWLAWDIVLMHGTVSCEHPGNVILGLQFYGDPEGMENEQ